MLVLLEKKTFLSKISDFNAGQNRLVKDRSNLWCITGKSHYSFVYNNVLTRLLNHNINLLKRVTQKINLDFKLIKVS
jgi:hypothetical protein